MSKDLTNQQFGLLTALRKVRSEQGKGVIWLCQCACGNEKEVPTMRLCSGHIRSCGCLKKIHAASIHQADITGQVFGHLTALRPTEKRSAAGSVVWELRCDCGNAAYYDVSTLVSGRAVSCGCLRSGSKAEACTRRWHEEGLPLLQSGASRRRDNRSGYTGVSYNVRSGKWVAYIDRNRKRYFLGSFSDQAQAALARQEAEGQSFPPLIP